MGHSFFLVTLFQHGKDTMLDWLHAVGVFLLGKNHFKSSQETGGMTPIEEIFLDLAWSPVKLSNIFKRKYRDWIMKERDPRLWYLILGTPQSGKSTLLSKSNLNLTRIPSLPTKTPTTCAAWKNKELVFLETSVACTEETNTIDFFNKFLQIFKRQRNKHPLHGILLTISTQDLLGSAADRPCLAQYLFQQLDAFYAASDHTPPLYIIITQADAIPGFYDFFTSFDDSQREQVLGCTLPDNLHTSTEGKLEILQAMLESLNRHLNQGLIHRLVPQVNTHAAHQIIHFSQYFATTCQQLHRFLQSVFRPIRVLETEQNIPLRGIYFTSCIEKKRHMPTSFHKHTMPQAGGSFFLHRLLTEIVFKEQHLVSYLKNKNLLHSTGQTWATPLIFPLLFGSTVFIALLFAYQVQIKKIELSMPISAATATQSASLTQELNLDEWTALFQSFPTPQHTNHSSLDRLSTYLFPHHTHLVTHAIQGVQERWITDIFLPFLISRVEKQISNRTVQPIQKLYETLRIYRMLETPSQWNKNRLADWIKNDWKITEPSTDVSHQQTLSRILDELQHVLSNPPMGNEQLPTGNEILKQSMRAQMGNNRLIELIQHEREQYLTTSPTLPPQRTWTQALGPMVGSVFVRNKQQVWTDPIPNAYTQRGYAAFHDHFSTWLSAWCHEASWVLDDPTLHTEAFIRNIQTQTEQSYTKAYTEYWMNLISNTKLKLDGNSADVIEISRWLSGTDSPLPLLLNLLVQETAPIEANLSHTQQDFATLYANLKADTMLTLINDLYLELSNMETARIRDVPIPPGHSIERVKAEGARLPEPFHTFFVQLYMASRHYQQASIRQKETLELKNLFDILPE